jgi:hypothetical protein
MVFKNATNVESPSSGCVCSVAEGNFCRDFGLTWWRALYCLPVYYVIKKNNLGALELLVIIIVIGAGMVVILENIGMKFESALTIVIFGVPFAYALLHISWQLLSALL